LSFSCIASIVVTALSELAGADESDRINIKAGRAAILVSEHVSDAFGASAIEQAGKDKIER
jgi:hypothetical protein